MPQDLKSIQDQINAQMHWDASEQEIQEWLRDKYSIVGEEADRMILAGINTKKSAIRKTSLIRMSIALVLGIPLAVLAYAGRQGEGRIGTRAAVLGSAALACFGYAGKNFLQIISGKSDTAIDA